ncbi:MAG: MarR family transcriptional regulator [Sphingobacteriaceae bacterium]|nr:MAG: MarR family transcriptional regulator [Sphingobacteriaceae bacterium]
MHVHGTTATEIGQRSMSFKQNISRTIKELEDKGIIVAGENKEDKRSERLNLTPEAKEFIFETHVKLDQLQEDYIKIVGEQNWQIATDVILKIITYHENLEKDQHNK